MINTIQQGDCIISMKTMPDESVDCCITSPPYWGLRDYEHDGQIGLEKTPEEYVEKMVAVFREVKRVLKQDGTLWLNLGDSYSSVHTGGHKSPKSTVGSNKIGVQEIKQSKANPVSYGLKPKDLVGIPWMVAFALRADGWYLRQDIIWAKPNPMPESVTDRCTKSHEYIFLLSKSAKYYYDNEAIMEEVAKTTITRMNQNVDTQTGSSRVPGKTNGNMKAVIRYGGKKYTENPDVFNRTKSGNAYDFRPFRNKRSVWTVATKPFLEAHFATFSEDLITPCVLAGCPENGIVLDPFMGAGTTAVAARKNNRNYIGCELNTEYITIAQNRIEPVEHEVAFNAKQIRLEDTWQ